MRHRHREGYKVVRRNSSLDKYFSVIIPPDDPRYVCVEYGNFWTHAPNIREPLTIFEKYIDSELLVKDNYLKSDEYGVFIAEYEIAEDYPIPCLCWGNHAWPIGTILCKRIQLIKEIT